MKVNWTNEQTELMRKVYYDLRWWCRTRVEDLEWRWRERITRHLMIPVCHAVCGSHWPVEVIMRHLSDLDESAMYGGICYALPGDAKVEDRVKISLAMIGYVRRFIKHNYLPEWELPPEIYDESQLDE